MAALLTVRTCGRCLRETARRLLVTESRGNVLPDKQYPLSRGLLKFDTFLKKKQKTLHYFQETKDGLFKNIEVKLQNSEAILEFEMKSLLHLCESPSDVQFAKECLKCYYKNVETSEFRFGPVFLRLCYEYGLIDTAFELLMDKSNRDAFSDSASFNVLLGILHEHRQYEKGLAALLEMKAQRVRLTKHTYLMAFAICYELNGPRSLETCTSLLEEALINGIIVTRQSMCFIIALALKQKEYQKALYVYDKITNKNHSLCCNLGLQIASGMENLEKVLQILETADELSDSELLKNLQLSQEVMDALEEKLKPTDLFGRFSNIYEQLKQSGKVSTLTMHEMLYSSSRGKAEDHMKRKKFNPTNEPKHLFS